MELTPTTIATSPQPVPSQILEDVVKLGVNPTPEVVGGKEKVEKLMQEVAKLRSKGVKEREARAEEIRGERMVESEIVVNAEELRAERENEEVERKSEGEEKTEGIEKVREEDAGEELGSDNDAEKEWGRDRASGDTEVLGGDEKADAMEEKRKEAEGSDDDCVEVTKEAAEEAGGTRTMGRVERRRKRFSKRLAKVIASREIKVKVEKVEELEVDPSENEEEEEEIPLRSRLRSSRAKLHPLLKDPRKNPPTHSPLKAFHLPQKRRSSQQHREKKHKMKRCPQLNRKN